MKKRFAFIIGIALVLMLALSACGVVNTLKSAGDTAKAFMDALKNNDSAGTWSMMTTALQEDIGAQSDWESYVSANTFGKYSFSSNSVENNVATLDGEATINSETYTTQLTLDQVDTGWLVSSISFSLK